MFLLYRESLQVRTGRQFHTFWLFLPSSAHVPHTVSAYQESKGLFLPKQAHQSNGVSLEEVKKG